MPDVSIAECAPDLSAADNKPLLRRGASKALSFGVGGGFEMGASTKSFFTDSAL
jgi:hypothetical protein